MQFRTGYPFPPLAQFEDLGKPENVLNGGSGSENSDGSTLKRSILGGPTLGLKKVRELGSLYNFLEL